MAYNNYYSGYQPMMGYHYQQQIQPTAVFSHRSTSAARSLIIAQLIVEKYVGK